MSRIDGALTPPGCFAIDLLGSPDRAKKTHAPDRMPPLMGKQFSAESCGKAVHFLFSRRVVNTTFFGWPSVSLLKGFVMPFLQCG